MSKERFILCQDDLGNYEIRYDDKVFHFLWEVAPILNEQQDTISQLEQENADRLGDKIRSLDEFEKCTNKLKERIIKQQAEIDYLKDMITAMKLDIKNAMQMVSRWNDE